MSARVALGFRAGRGGSVVVGVAEGRHVVLSTFLATAAEGDRPALEPYTLGYELARRGEAPAAIEAAVAEGRARQDRLAAEGLARILRELRKGGFEPATAALLVNRAGWITDLLSYSLGAPEHPAVAEGLAVRDALRSAFRTCGVEAVETDEKSLPDTASAVLGLSPGELDARLKDLGASVGRPWRKEQKLAALAAWLSLMAR